MSRIDLHNYEAFLLDYLEGRLDENGISALKLFALAHPELEIRLGEHLPALERDDVRLENKTDFLKFSTPAEDQLCAYVENILPGNERAELEAKINADPLLQAELKVFQKTILAPELSVRMEKDSLYRTEDDLALNNQVLQYLEGQLPGTALRDFELQLLADPELQKELRVHQQLRLVPEAVGMPYREQLKRSAMVFRLFPSRRYAAAAAVLLLAALSAIFLLTDPGPDPVIIAAGESPAGTSNDYTQPAIAAATPGQLRVEPEMLQPSEDKIPSGKAIRHPQPALRQEVTQNNKLLAGNLPETKTADTAAGSAIVLSDTVQPFRQIRLPAITEPEQGEMIAATDAVQKDQLPLYEISEDESDLFDSENGQGSETSFWQRVTRLAGEANKLGIKSVDGELSKEGFRISFLSFSVEKK